MLGKLLGDAVRQKHDLSRTPVVPREKLAIAAGGYYSPPDFFVGAPSISGEVENPESEFGHYMPHGTFTMVQHNQAPLSLMNAIYSRVGTVRLANGEQIPSDRAVLNHYYYDTFIHFPWEPTGRGEMFEKQVYKAAIAVRRAKRIHFIGISGHKLMAHSLNTIFKYVDTESAFQDIEWHLATAEPDPKQVFDKLLDCLLPQRFAESPAFRLVLHDNLKNHIYPTFAEWLRVSPHLRPV